MQRPDLSLFPDSPGVYLFKDASGKILYVGKARRLRRRIASYFRPEEQLPSKTTAMLRRAESLDFLSTGTEKEALLLEAGLIKKHRPRYNIVLRDDKDYLLFRISSRHPFPRVEIIRRAGSAERKGGDKIFGPFSSGGAAREETALSIRDRFGPFPEELANFLAVLDFKQFLTELQVQKAEVRRESVRLTWPDGQTAVQPERIVALAASLPGARVHPPAGLALTLEKDVPLAQGLDRLRQALEDIRIPVAAKVPA